MAAICVNVAIAGAVTAMLLTVLRDYTCQDFAFGVVLPFFVTELYDSFTVGLLILWIRYQVMNSCGKELEEKSSVPAPPV